MTDHSQTARTAAAAGRGTTPADAPRRVPCVVRFAIAGGIASTINWLSRFPISHVLPFAQSVVLAYIVGMLAGFVLYRLWVFEADDMRLLPQVRRFVLINLLGLLVVSIVSFVLDTELQRHWLEGHAGRAEATAHGIAILAGAVFNFLGHKLFTFARRSMRRGRPGAVAA